MGTSMNNKIRLMAIVAFVAAAISTTAGTTASAAEGDYLVGNTTSADSGVMLRMTPTPPSVEAAWSMVLEVRLVSPLIQTVA